MRVELADVISSENKEMSKQAEIELLSFDSKLGQFPVVKKEPFVLTFTNEENRRLSRGKRKLQLQFHAAAALRK